MQMTAEEFDRERQYQTVMVFVRKMLEQGLITEEEYYRIDTKNRAKYRPATDTLLSGKFLLFKENRAIMPTGKEAQSFENGNKD